MIIQAYEVSYVGDCHCCARKWCTASGAQIGKEGKDVFDVLLPEPANPSVFYGLSCKMRRELNKAQKPGGRVTMEVSNSAGKFWNALNAKGINPTNYTKSPLVVGTVFVEVVSAWYHAKSLTNGGKVDITKSSYLVLSYNNKGWYQLHQFHLEFPNPENLIWSYPLPAKTNRSSEVSRRLKSEDISGTVIEWYGESGGQLKYYPLADDAIWQSEPFRLEPLPDQEHGVLAKAASYFPHFPRLTLP